MTVKMNKRGFWEVIIDGKKRAVTPTNREAWRIHDQMTGELENKRQEMAEWFLRRQTDPK